MPQVSYIIVNFNTRDLLDDCLASIYRWTVGVTMEVIVVDNNSTDGSQEMVREKHPDVILIESQENLGFGRGNNLGFEHAKGDFLMLFNSDAILERDTSSALVSFLESKPEVGLVGPAVLLRDGSNQPKTRGMLPSLRTLLNQNLLLNSLFPRSRFLAGLYVETAWEKASQVGWISGVCMMIRRKAYLDSGGFDPKIFMYAEDIDLCQRCAALGWQTWRIEDFAIKHLCGGSTKSDEQIVRNRVMQQRNSFKVFNATMSPIGQALARASFLVGLSLRALIRAIPALSGRGKVTFQADIKCLADLLGLRQTSTNKPHANRN